MEGLLREYEVVDLARTVLGDPGATVTRWWVETVGYPFGSPTTEGLYRIRGTAAAPATSAHEVGWSAFVKLVRSYRHWPLFAVLPPALRERAAAGGEWRFEADVYTQGLGDALPDGLRLPLVHRVLDLGDDRIALFLEDVATAAGPWDRVRFTHAARLLGRMAARLTRHDALPPSASRIPGEITATYWTGRVLVAALPALSDDATWAHPAMAAADPDLRGDLGELAGRVPALLDTLTRLTQTLGHGDASPQNLLVPAAAPETFVAVDWTLGGLAAAGDDLGQLLVGLARAGETAGDELPALHDALVTAFTAGLAEEGLGVEEPAVRHGMDGGLVVRSAFTALPLERLREPLTDELADLLAARMRLTRYLVELGLALPQGA